LLGRFYACALVISEYPEGTEAADMPKKTAAIAVALVCVLSTYPTLAQAPPPDFEPNFREA